MKTFRPLPAVQGVAPGSIATLDCPIGLTYHGILFTGKLSDVSQLRVKGNGRTIFTVNGADLAVHNGYEGRPSHDDETQFYLDFERYGLNTAVGPTPVEALRGREVTAIGTGVPASVSNMVELTTFQIEMDIKADAVAPYFSAKGHQSPARSLGLLKKRRRFSYTNVGEGDFEISDLPKGDLIDKIFIHSSVADSVTRVRLQRDNFLAFDRTPAENDLIQADGVRVPQSGLFVLDPSERGRGDEALVTAGVADFRLIITNAEASTITVYVDYLGSLTGN